MSVDVQVLSASTVVAGGAATASELANTGNPVLVGIITGAVLIVILGIVTRVAHRNQ